MKKFLVVVVLLAILAGVGYGGYVLYHNKPAADEMQAEQPADTPAVEGDTPAPEQAESPAEPAGPLVLSELGCELQSAEGWAIDEAAQELSIVPGGQGVVLRKGDPGAPPFLVIGQVSGDALGTKDPTRFAGTFVAELRSRFAKLRPAPKITGGGAPKELPALLTSGQELLAEGSFAKLGLPSGSARLLAGVAADQKVYLIAAFTAVGSDDEAAVDEMIASLKPATKAEAEPAAEAPADSSADAETPAEASSQPAAEESPAAQPAESGEEPAAEGAKGEEKPAAEGEKAEAKPATPAKEEPKEDL